MSVREDIVSAIWEYHKKNRKYPEVLELSWGAAYSLCKLGADELGTDIFEELFARGPQDLDGETLMGCKVKLIEPVGAVIIAAKGTETKKSRPTTRRPRKQQKNQKRPE